MQNYQLVTDVDFKPMGILPVLMLKQWKCRSENVIDFYGCYLMRRELNSLDCLYCGCGIYF